MPLPWNRGDEERRTPLWADLMPLVGDTGDRSEEDRERSQPVLVAPHRDPGEDAENHDLPPGFERARAASGPRGEPTSVPVEADEASPTSSRGDPAPDTATPRAAAPDAATPGAARLDELTSDAAPGDARSPDPVEGSPDAGDPSGTVASTRPDAAGNETSEDGTDDPEDAPRDSTAPKDTVTPNNR